ncbi:thermonuclease family protein [Rhodococcus sp. UNC23MFCrub1.1]|uniref:thermonuclease family protein n=1 Tax=Rhodococcus sp. UNC23MFCrub1.1 TaxID=1449068 RepID=UPI001E3C75DB|nr:thermonuclease family protein [Rhodococcus sp. UNC23MFCrub1.1]
MTNIVDGDTVDVTTTSGDTVRVRLIGIDTPETVEPGAAVQCWGPEATAYADMYLDGQTVTMNADPTGDDVDDYGRLLRYLTLADGADYSVIAADAGMARAYIFDESHPPVMASQIANGEYQARVTGRGLWGPPCNGDT